MVRHDIPEKLIDIPVNTRKSAMVCRPTQKQLETLKAIRLGAVARINMGYAAFRITGANPSVVGRCVKGGWAKWPEGLTEDQTCELTAEGKAVLSSATDTQF
ncbi:hypothetical protein [Thalassospira sp. MCCC 1A01428]|uniref:hypothetical protein n=1 Tax=Thalassospira sp. MCCC 1A01428 TaxID=1470575 RepID=UPI00111C92E0|nr:hypothetical protein [Thalassospira sp. MCCC 1A01428]